MSPYQERELNRWIDRFASEYCSGKIYRVAWYENNNKIYISVKTLELHGVTVFFPTEYVLETPEQLFLDQLAYDISQKIIEQYILSPGQQYLRKEEVI